MQIVPIADRFPLEHYRSVVPNAAIIDELQQRGAALKVQLDGRKLWMVNSTATGGGVAEMMPTLCYLLRDLGVDVDWAVIETDDPVFFGLTKKLHNYIHGFAPDGKTPGVSDEERACYERVSQENVEALLPHIGENDVVVIHDPQPAGAGFLLKQAKPNIRMHWRCHIGVDFDNDATQAAWDFLAPWLEPYEQRIFTATEYVPDYCRSGEFLLPPAIDPLSEKNAPQNTEDALAYIRSIPIKVVSLDGNLRSIDYVPLQNGPLCLQISRWDQLKGWTELLRGFAQMKQGLAAREYDHYTQEQHQALADSYLVLGGPDPSGVSDDPEGMETLEQVIAAYNSYPEDIRCSICVALLPLNHQLVSALQQVSTVVIQNSLQEGFGLTVTEAMWKGLPVIGTNAVGIKLQIQDRENGLRISDAKDPALIAANISWLLAHDEERAQIAAQAKHSVGENFLITRQIADYFTIVERSL